ncbi:MAG: hypothetical protein K9H25_18245 [Rhodospirillum sp.]|nr:hypothetical protein [Rhodospirillum sp.]MCF8490839.1 hypothetical protein [Rhodospirillum sp.]MCF8501398.1 hypothetical protein [Rhodospirillum sp.]
MPWSVIKRSVVVLLALVGVCYPVLVYFGLSAFSPRVLLTALVILVLVRALLFLLARKATPTLITLAIAVVLTAVGWVAEPLAIRLYPVAVSLTMALIFTLTLVRPPPMIERFARQRDPTLDAFGQRYTRTLTKVWIGFFLVNASIAGWTVAFGSLEQWTLYNGILSYLLIGLLFFGEWPIRRIIRRRAAARGDTP